MLTRELGRDMVGTNEGDVEDVVMLELRGQFERIRVFGDDAEDLVWAIPAIIEFVEVGEGSDSF